MDEEEGPAAATLAAVAKEGGVPEVPLLPLQYHDWDDIIIMDISLSLLRKCAKGVLYAYR
jgi:hypothetical protein